MDAERNDEHFEAVLGRLDSLIRRGQPAMQPPPPPQVSEATIPVLTEIYDGEAALPVIEPKMSEPQVSEQAKLEQAMAAVLPLMTGILEDALIREVQPAMEAALKRVLQDLRPQIESMLRERLQAPPAQDDTANV